jgi:phenylalanyl-tRNA synthetase beta chain
MHAYDYDKIADNKLIIRDARKGEKLQAINHKEYTLDKKDIVITDAKKIQSIAGIMGATTSEVDENTENVLLEAAVFDPVQILKTSRKQGIRSEAGIRFSKGVDVTKTKAALEECANLIVEMTQADIASEVLEIKSEEFKPTQLDFDLNLTEELAGTEIDVEQMLIFLQRLGIEVENRNEIDVTNTNQINVPVVAKLKIPTWRRDLNIPEDIVEEIVRIFGYNNIEPRLLDVKSEFNKLPEIGSLNRKVRANMLKMSYNEVITYSFISDQLKELFSIKDRQLIKITNAISPELNYFRNSLLPSLIEVYTKNQDNYEDISIFEIGRTVNNYEHNDEKIPEQHWKLGVLKSINADDDRQAYFEFKGVVEKLLEMLGFDITDYKWEVFKPEKSVFFENSFHEYRASNLNIKGEIIGGLGEVDPFIVEKITKKHVKIFFAQLDLEKLLEIYNNKLEENKKAVEVDILPSVKRDLSFWIKERQKLGEIFDELHDMKIKSKKQVKIKPSIMDEYFVDESKMEGKSKSKDKSKSKNKKKPNKDQTRSVTFSLEIQPQDDTLTDEEANKIIEEIIEHLNKKFSVELRSQ